MRFLLDQQSYDELLARTDHTDDCYVHAGEYLHHMYVDGIKYVVARALYDRLKEANTNGDAEAVRHLQMHRQHLEVLVGDAQRSGTLAGARMLGSPLPDEEVAPPSNTFFPLSPKRSKKRDLIARRFKS